MFEQKYSNEVNFEIISLLCSPSSSCQLSCSLVFAQAAENVVRLWIFGKSLLGQILTQLGGSPKGMSYFCLLYLRVLDLMFYWKWASMLRQIRGVVPVHDTFTFQTRRLVSGGLCHKLYFTVSTKQRFWKGHFIWVEKKEYHSTPPLK